MALDMKTLLTEAKTIAVVGLSDKPARASYGVAEYLQRAGYKIIPVNPMIDQVLGEKSYASLRDVPHKIDIVDIFRRSEDVLPIVEDAIAIGAPTVWMQLGVIHPEAAAKASEAGLNVVMDKCLKIEHARYGAE